MTCEPLQTVMARGDAERADDAWKTHKQACPKCVQRRERCRTGQQHWDAREAARAELARQRQLDAQPDPNQAVLF